MSSSRSMIELLFHLWSFFSPRRRVQFFLLLTLMLLVSISEILSIGIIIPFLGVLTSPDRIFELSFAKHFIQFFELSEPSQLLLPITVIFCILALTAGLMRLMLLWVNTRLSFSTGADLGVQIYQRTLYQSYEVHCSRNSSEIINVISGKTNEVINLINMVLTVISSAIILIAILCAILFVNPLMAFLAFGSFGFIYFVIIRSTRKKLLLNSKLVAQQSTYVIKSLQEGLGGIRDVLLNANQASYCELFSSADQSMRRAQASNTFIAASPRYLMEALGMVLIAVLAYTLTKQTDGISKAIPVLGALAISAQRLLPVLQQAYSSWSWIQASRSSLQDTLELLDQSLPNYAKHLAIQPIVFNQSIKLDQVGFHYKPNSSFILNQISLNISKGSRVGFIGSTGSGKSTLLDIIMGLLQPTSGSLKIDNQLITPENNRSWQMHIAHVPQSIFLADSSIEENIAFGVPKSEIDHHRVIQAARQAQIDESIQRWPEKYQTFVGERGIRLSGGQRQRIGIARALYKQADVIIFDEATSALDSETEQAVMHAIESLSKELTLLIIAHRLSTLKNCTQVVELAGGKIKKNGSYKDFVNQLI